MWYKSTFRKRARSSANIVVICTRWSKKDLVQHLLEEDREDWTLIKLPEVAQKNDPLGRSKGECLCPGLFTQKEVDIKNDGSIVYHSMCQQEPSNIEGGIFKRENFKRWTILPLPFDDSLISVDCNFGDDIANESNSQISIQYWGRKDSYFYLVDRENVAMEFWQFLHFLKDFIAKHQNVHLRLVESKANGAATLSTLKRKIAGFEPWQAQGKMVQAVNTQPAVKSEHVFIPDAIDAKYTCANGEVLDGATWVNDWLKEVTDFPQGKHDDDVDAFCQAILKLEERTDMTTIMISRG